MTYKPASCAIAAVSPIFGVVQNAELKKAAGWAEDQQRTTSTVGSTSLIVKQQ